MPSTAAPASMRRAMPGATPASPSTSQTVPRPGGAGGDALDGGAGLDAASYAGSDAGVTVNLATGAGSGGHATGDTLTGIENVIGSIHADTLTGNGGDKKLHRR